jgi:hypothetical protein
MLQMAIFQLKIKVLAKYFPLLGLKTVKLGFFPTFYQILVRSWKIWPNN